MGGSRVHKVGKPTAREQREAKQRARRHMKKNKKNDAKVEAPPSRKVPFSPSSGLCALFAGLLLGSWLYPQLFPLGVAGLCWFSWLGSPLMLLYRFAVGFSASLLIGSPGVHVWVLSLPGVSIHL